MANTASVRRPRTSRTTETGPRLAGVARPPGAADSPEPRPEFVSRPQLVGRLIRSPASVALIAAPAGYGKTTLAREWDGWDTRPFGWVMLEDRHDRHAPDLIAEIEEALDALAPAEPRRRAGSTRSRRAPAAVALARLVRSLESRPPLVLMLDDVRVLRTSAALEAVRTIARHMPGGSTLGICSRTEPALPIGRMR